MKQEGTTDFGLTSDGLFPLTYSEKIIFNIHIIGPGIEKIEVTAGGYI